MFKIDNLISSHGYLPEEFLREACELYYMGFTEIGEEIESTIRKRKRRRIEI